MPESSISTSFWDVLLQMGGSVTILAFVAVGIILAGVSGLRYMRRKAKTEPVVQSDNPIVASDALLDALEQTTFKKASVLSDDEARVLRCLAAWERRQTKGYRVLAGVPLGTLVTAQPSEADPEALKALAQVRVDFAVIDAAGEPALMIDMPGRAIEGEDAARDAAIRQITCDKARLHMIAPEAGTGAAAVVAQVDKALETGLIKEKKPIMPRRPMAQVA
ncbi:MAG: DUF2726 domain-containing protein [Dinoroseobacter sp.]|nr:DUF2726 domain-containing protein [Dinoroseobacter sp.]MDJ0994864.1 DUF2726 domain-containing protein [Dinoroseobacter sp.]